MIRQPQAPVISPRIDRSLISPGYNRAEESLRLSETRYRRLFETAQDGILILDAASGQVVDANPFMRILLGYSQEEFLGRKLWEIGPFKGVQASKTAFAELQEKDQVRYEGLSLETKAGKRVEVEFVSNAYFVEERRFIQCNIRDITARRRAEESLRLSETRYRRLFETAQDGILILDAETGQVVDANRYLRILLAYSEQELLGKKLWEIGPFKGMEASKSAFAGLQEQDRIRYEALPLETKDGRRVEVEFVSNAYFVDQRRFIQCNIRDITERKRAEEQMRGIRDQLEQTNLDLLKRSKEIQYFYHTLSHELKTPLTSAREFVSIVIDGLAGELNSTQLKYLGIAKDSCTELAVYINDLLDATRLDTGKLHMELKAVSLAAIIQRATAIMAPVAAGKKIRLSEELDARVKQVLVDESRIMQILTNLLNNALKFTGEGGQIVVKLEEDLENSRYVRISVTDTGRGIPRDQIANLFDRFFQVKEGDATPGKGVGLGLYLCREMVLLHGGEIWVESVFGSGSTFAFTIPKQAVANRRQVLIIDDDEQMRDALSLLLEKGGFDVATASGGNDALQQINQKTPDLVVLDLMMSGRDGPSTLQEIRKNVGSIAVIVHTGYPDSELMQRALQSAPFTLLAKPCPPAQFVDTVRKLCSAPEPLLPEQNRRLQTAPALITK